MDIPMHILRVEGGRERERPGKRRTEEERRKKKKHIISNFPDKQTGRTRTCEEEENNPPGEKSPFGDGLDLLGESRDLLRLHYL